MNFKELEKRDRLLKDVRDCLRDINLEKNNIYRISPRCRGNECDLPYKAVYISKYIQHINHPWVSICWSECFEKTYEKDNTPFWIEFDEDATSKLLLELDKVLTIRVQPANNDRKIIPVSIQDMFIPFDVAKRVYKFAETTL